eukprot:762879-Hanusia_phi.AAC.1
MTQQPSFAYLKYSFPQYACNKNPNIAYCSGCKNAGGIDCAPDTCQSCKTSCVAFNYGSNATSTLHNLAARIFAVEGEFSALSTYASYTAMLHNFTMEEFQKFNVNGSGFTLKACQQAFRGNAYLCIPMFPKHNNTENATIITALTYSEILNYGSWNGSAIVRSLQPIQPGSPLAPEGTFEVSMSVKWGYLDVFGQWESFPNGSSSQGLCNLSNVTEYDIAEVSFRKIGAAGQETRSLYLRGTYSQVVKAFQSSYFRALDISPSTNVFVSKGPGWNSDRVRHLQLSPKSTAVQPWFQIDFWIGSPNNPIDMTKFPDMSQLIWVIPINNPPTITDPQVGYLPGCISSPPCNTNFSKFVLDGPQYYFGQYWLWEGSTKQLVLTGIEIDDPDIDEGCFFQDSEPCNWIDNPNLYFCGTMKLELSANIGRVLLNSRDGLTFLEDSPSRIVVTGLKSHIADAIREVLYRIDTVINMISGSSKYLFQNSQHLGSSPDFLQVVLNDQGNFGENGYSEYASTATHKNGLIINITIAAVNNPPSIQVGNSYTAYENRPYSIDGFLVNDIDVNEIITSKYAEELWLGYLYNLPYTNKIRITAQLNGYNNGVARGLLYINSDGTNLHVVSNGSHVIINVSSTYAQNYACSFKESISFPASFHCTQETPASGALCMGAWDNRTCRRIGEGVLQLVNNSNTRFHIADFSSSLIHYLNNVSSGLQIEFGIVTSAGVSVLGEVSSWDSNSSEITLSSARTDIRLQAGAAIRWQ